MKKYQKGTVYLVIALVGAVGLLACGGSGKSGNKGGSPKSGGTLSVGIGADVSSTVPWVINQTSARAVTGQIYDSLFSIPITGTKVQPALATSYKVSKDGRTYTVSLRRGVKFHNGTELTSADVVWTMKQDKKSSAVGSSLANVSSITASDPFTVVMKLKAPQPDLLLTIASPAFGIVPKGFGGKTESAFSAHPIGTGPFQFAGRVVGSSMTFERNPHYWAAGKPRVDKVVYRVFQDVNSESVALRAGAIQLVQGAPLSALATMKGTVLNQSATSDMEMLQVNGAKAPMDNLKLRQALSHAINRKLIVSSLIEGHGEAARALMSPATFPYGVPSDTTGAYAYDASKAKAELAASSYKSGQRLSLIYSTGIPGDADIAAAIQGQAKDVGINLQLQPLESSSWLKAVTTFPGTWDLSLSHAGGLTPTDQLGFIVDSQYFGGSWPVQDAKAGLAAYYAAKTPKQQQAALAAFEARVATYLPGIPVVNRKLLYVAGPTLHGLTLGPDENYSLASAWLS
jgi:peptide/nickel transport system substrate-binding protein